MLDTETEGVHRAAGGAQRAGSPERGGERHRDGGDEGDLRQYETPRALNRADLAAQQSNEIRRRLRALGTELALEWRLVGLLPESHLATTTPAGARTLTWD
jgi:hypothetical protein